MKWVYRFFALFLLLSQLMGTAAAADTIVTYTAEGVNQRWTCETFDAQMTQDAQSAFSGRLLAEDRVICGAELTAYGKDSDTPLAKRMLMAVQRAEKVLLYAAFGSADGWTTAIESDCFFADAQDVTITSSAGMNASGAVSHATLTIAADQRYFDVLVMEDASVVLRKVRTVQADGSEFVIDPDCPDAEQNVSCYVRQAGITEQESAYACVFPVRLAAWTMDNFPATRDALEEYASSHQRAMLPGQGYLNSVNLRAEPTGSSASLGIYRARVQVYDHVSGEKVPWYHVSVGDLQGWVSGRYLITENEKRICEFEREMLPVARAQRELMLYDAPGGAEKGVVPEGTIMHVLLAHDGVLHVIIPRKAISWQTDWDGTYGFVSSDGVKTGTSYADVIY